MRFGRSSRDPFSFDDKGRTLSFKRFIILLLCFIVIFFIAWSFLAQNNNQENLTEIELTSLKSTINKQQNQILTLQELIHINKQALDQSKPQIDQLTKTMIANEKNSNPIGNEDNKWKEIENKFKEYEDKMDEIETELRKEFISLHSLINQNLNDFNEFKDDIEEIKEQIEKLSLEKDSIKKQIEENQKFFSSSSSHEATNNQDSTTFERNQDHIYVILVDFGAFLDMYERRRSKIVSCGLQSVGLNSVEKMYATIDSLYEIEEKGNSREFTILLSTTKARSNYFDDLHGIEIVISSAFAFYIFIVFDMLTLKNFYR